MTGFEARNITCGYGKRRIINELSFKLDNGRLVGLVGVNGCGKTTLIKAICSILPHGGECFVDGKRLENMSPLQLSRLCAYIPQRSGITIDVSALDVVLMGLNPELHLFERPSEKMLERAKEALKSVGLRQPPETNYATLSEGQKALCIMARALVSHPRGFFFDEPESSLDFSVRNRILALLRDRVHNDSSFALVSLHDPSLALNYCDELLAVSDGALLERLDLHRDSSEKIESVLSEIWGEISVVRCMTRSGKERFSVVWEGEE